jgi:hypothetical protein
LLVDWLGLVGGARNCKVGPIINHLSTHDLLSWCVAESA